MMQFAWTALLIVALAAWTALASNPKDMDPATFKRELEATFQPPPPSPAAPQLADEKEGREADAIYLQAYPDHERAYTPAARNHARQLLGKLRADARHLTRDQFTLRVSEIVALADNAHSHTGTAFQKNTRRIPLRFYWFPDGLHVLRAKPAFADLLGARVDQIDGLTPEIIFQRIRRYNGGTETWRRQALTPMLESPGLLHAAGVARASTMLTVSGVLANGYPFSRVLTGEERDQSAPISAISRLIYPTAPDAPMPGVLSKAGALPLYLRAHSSFFQLDDLAARGVFIGLGITSDSDDESIAVHLAKVERHIANTRPSFAVVDLRTNTGGDFTTTFKFASALPSRVERVYVLTSGWTLSAAMHTAAAIKQAAPDRVTIVGEPVGDRMQFWSEGGQFVLPNTPLIVSYTTGKHNFAGPCDDLRVCFWLSALPGQFQVRVQTLDPDISAPLTFAAYRSGHDPALEAVLEREQKLR